MVLNPAEGVADAIFICFALCIDFLQQGFQIGYRAVHVCHFLRPSIERIDILERSRDEQIGVDIRRRRHMFVFLHAVCLGNLVGICFAAGRRFVLGLNRIALEVHFFDAIT